MSNGLLSRGLGPARTSAQGRTSPSTDRLRRFLEAYWLRPENAFWMTLRSEALAPHALKHPSTELSCGDGVFSFLHAGGVLDPAFDVFSSVGHLDRVQSQHADMFDHVSDEYQPPIQTPVADRIDVGSDVKQTLLAKAKRLNLFDRLIEADNNQPLPFDDECFQTIYCNSAYWVANIDGYLAELRRTTRSGGRIILHVKLDSLHRYTLARHHATLGGRFLDIIGRGRVECWPSVASRSVWESRFAAAGLVVEHATPFVTRTHAHIWDIGLRPVAPMLVKMADALRPETRATIKREWVDLFCELLRPICDPTFDLFADEDEPAEIQYVLTTR